MSVTVTFAHQPDAGRMLVGRLVIFAHWVGSKAERNTPVRVVSSDSHGMVELEGFVGSFAPHLFVVVSGPETAS